MDERIDRKTMAAVLVFLALVFFFSNHAFQGYERHAEDGMELSADLVEEKLDEGNLPRRASMLALGLFSLFFLFRKSRLPFGTHGILPWALAVFGLWAWSSLAWSVDASVTAKKLLVFSVLCTAALAMAVSFPMDFLPLCVFGMSALYLCLGVSIEILNGSFHPLAAGYRFSGTVHPNIQGIHCGLMALSGISLHRSTERRWRHLFLAGAVVALAALLLTKSRTSLLCAVVAQSLFFLGTSRKSAAVYYALGSFSWVVLASMLFRDHLDAIPSGVALLGRGSDEIRTLTGRTDLWGECIGYALDRPVQGYGFHSFWDTGHMQKVFASLGSFFGNAHSAYLDVLLGTGVVGLLLFLSILAIATKRAFSRYARTQDTGFAFLSVIFVYFMINGLTESDIIEFPSFSSFVLLWGIFLLAFQDSSGVQLRTGS